MLQSAGSLASETPGVSSKPNGTRLSTHWRVNGWSRSLPSLEFEPRTCRNRPSRASFANISRQLSYLPQRVDEIIIPSFSLRSIAIETESYEAITIL
ncbi:hypothetical protein TNCV_4376331 [Trichonephila clavipes]|nr:hypothetical protein TNCV_4376331 [Trichonephila clavipes]